MDPKRWSIGQFAVFLSGAVLLELALWGFNRVTARPLWRVRLSGRDYFFEDNIEPLLHLVSWLLLVVIPIGALVLAWKRFDQADPHSESRDHSHQ